MAQLKQVIKFYDNDNYDYVFHNLLLSNGFEKRKYYYQKGKKKVEFFTQKHKPNTRKYLGSWGVSILRDYKL